jgi:uncharacterized protein
MEKPYSHEIESYLRKADKSVRAARILFDNGIYEDSMSRAYYAMHYAARAALLTEKVAPKTHRGLISEFGNKLVRMGTLTKKELEELSAGLRYRLKSDYEPDFEIDKADLKEQISNAEKFIESIKKFINP